MKVEKLVLEVVMVLLEPPVETEMGGTTVALVGMPVTEVVDLNPFSNLYSKGGRRTNPVEVEAGLDDAVIGELLLVITTVLLPVEVVVV
jgi:hypothetical protein